MISFFNIKVASEIVKNRSHGSSLIKNSLAGPTRKERDWILPANKFPSLYDDREVFLPGQQHQSFASFSFPLVASRG